jgi:hypothetical protein
VTPRTRECTQQVRAGRLAKAIQFAEVFDQARILAEEAREDVADACVTLAVHAGIAAADVICCTRLGVHAHGENHAESIALLRSADPDRAANLSTLLGMKSRARYSHDLVNAEMLRRAERAMTALVAAAWLV